MDLAQHNQDIHEDYRLPDHCCGNCRHASQEADDSGEELRCTAVARPHKVAERNHCNAWELREA